MPARGLPVEPLESRTLLSAYWVTLQYPTTIESDSGWMHVKDQYDQDQDGVSDYPVTASTPLEAIREAVEGAYCGTVNHCGTQSSLSYSFPARASTDGSDAYQINLSTFPTTGVGSGGIGLQKSWDDPYWDRNVYLPNWSDAALSVTADPRPKVWLQDGTDLSASENGRDPATFTIQREGGDSQSLDVYFLLSGSATPSTLSEGSYPDGVAEDGTDYTVSGASPDPNHPGYWKATLAAGQNSVDVTAKPLNDSGEEPLETMGMSLVGDLAGQLNGAAGYMLADAALIAAPAGTQPATRATTQQGNLRSLRISIDAPQRPTGHAPTNAEKAALAPSLDMLTAQSWQQRDEAQATLTDAAIQNPMLLPYYDGYHGNDPPSEFSTRVQNIRNDVNARLQADYPFNLSLTTSETESVLGVNLLNPPPAGTDSLRVFIYSLDNDKVKAEFDDGSSFKDFPANTTTLTGLKHLIDFNAGRTKLHIKVQYRQHVQDGDDLILDQTDKDYDVTVDEEP